MSCYFCDSEHVVCSCCGREQEGEPMEATIIPNAVKVEDSITRDGIDWLTIAYDGTYDAYKASPVALEYKGKKYTRMSHNSDTLRISYRTGVPFAMKF